nr:hypothetical protein [uncultured bacterium]
MGCLICLIFSLGSIMNPSARRPTQYPRFYSLGGGSEPVCPATVRRSAIWQNYGTVVGNCHSVAH